MQMGLDIGATVVEPRHVLSEAGSLAWGIPRMGGGGGPESVVNIEALLPHSILIKVEGGDISHTPPSKLLKAGGKEAKVVHAIKKSGNPTIFVASLKKGNVKHDEMTVEVRLSRGFVPVTNSVANPLHLDRIVPKLPQERPTTGGSGATRNHPQKQKLDLLEGVVKNMVRSFHPEIVDGPNLAGIRADRFSQNIKHAEDGRVG